MGKIRTSAAALLTGLALAVSVGAAAEPASAATTGCQVSFSHYDTIKKGSKGAQARSMECLLRQAGRSTSVNGSFSAHDASQLAVYRASKGFRPLKVAGRLAWASLLSAGSTPTLHRGDRGADVLRLQRSLQSLGWTTIDIDGHYDARTVAVVKLAQHQRHLSRTGTTTPALWRALQNGHLAGPAKPKAKPASSSKGAKALAFAKKQLGDRYRFGATGPSSWDCSGLTGGAWKAAGVKLPRTSQAQYHVGKHISKADLKPGDLVFFYSGPSHVAIYAGGGKVIHAPRPGEKVSYIKMKYMPFHGARRPS